MSVTVPPFYENRQDDMSCMLAVYRSVIQRFTGKRLSWKELETLTGYRNGKAAWTLKALTELAHEGWDIKMFEPFDYAKYHEQGVPYLQEVFTKEEAEWQLKNSNIRDIRPLIPDFLRTVRHIKKQPTLDDIDAMVDEGRLVSLVLNSHVLNSKDGYLAHNVLVYAHDQNSYTFHDPGLPGKPSRTEPKESVLEAMGNAAEATGFKLRD